MKVPSKVNKEDAQLVRIDKEKRRVSSPLHDMLLGAVIQHPDAHFAFVRCGKQLDRCGIEGRTQPFFRIQTKIFRFHALFFQKKHP